MLEAETLIARSRHVQDAIVASVSPRDATFANTILPLGRAENAQLLGAGHLMFYSAVSPSSEIRSGASRARTLIDNFELKTVMREDLFELINAVYRKVEKGEDVVDTEDRHLLEDMRERCVIHGVSLLEGSQKERFLEIGKRLDELVDEFWGNVTAGNEEGSENGLWFTTAELEGVGDDSLHEFQKGTNENEGKYFVKDFSHVFYYAKSEKARETAWLASKSKYDKNIEVFKEAVVLRDEAARLLGFDNHADFMVKRRMVKSLDAVNTFLGDLIAKLTVTGKRDIEQLKALKKEELESRGELFDGHFYLWDLNYYQKMLKDRIVSVPWNKIREYFPLQTVLAGMLGIFQDLFCIEFIKIVQSERDTLASSGNGGDLVWHEDVQLFGVWDKDQGREFLGYLYLDLFSREGKVGGMRACNIIPVC